MLNLTFGEQVKIVLSRKGMTIKELAEEIEEKTAKKMSRQNLTQRLGRDNFQEQDMRVIAEILGCSFQLSILADSDAAERAGVNGEVRPTDKEIEKVTKKRNKKGKTIFLVPQEDLMEEEKKRSPAERDITIGELVAIQGELAELQKNAAHQEKWHEEAAKTVDADISEEERSVQQDMQESDKVPEPDKAQEPEVVPEVLEEALSKETKMEAETAEPANVQNTYEKGGNKKNPLMNAFKGYIKKASKGQIEDAPKSAAETTVKPVQEEVVTIQSYKEEKAQEKERHPEMNPYTGLEYETNSVRMHPSRIGYVQVYDRKEKQWTDMTEWAFLGYQERKKTLLGKDYRPPIYLD